MLEKEKIELFAIDTQAVLSTDGGCLQKFAVDGYDLLYPETLREINGQKKKRGGMPILFPWTGALENYPQHGFARNLKWQKLKVHKDLLKKRALLELTDNRETFKIFPYHFRCQLKVELKEKELFYLLTVLNENQKKMPISPGFHPYFKIPGDFEFLKTNIDGFEPRNYKLTETLFFPIQSVEMKIPDLGEIRINYGQEFTRQQAKLAVWTDNQDYLCVEPWSTSLGGFLKEEERLNLLPGQKAEFSLTLKFFPR